MNNEGPTQSTEPQQAKPKHEEIAECAYLIWEKEGCPDGHDVDHWYQAELQLGTTNSQRVAGM